MFLGSVVVLKLGESALQQSQLSLKVVSVTLILSQLKVMGTVCTGNLRSVVLSCKYLVTGCVLLAAV